MRIIEFLKDTVDGKLSLEEQKKYLEDNPFGSSEEIAEAVTYLYGQMAQAPKLSSAIDICGTGGSGLPRINTSTISAFIVAGAGVKVAKHGNNAASGKFGSFDLIAALDIPVNLSVDELQLRFNEYNLAFLYARNFHPVMKFFAPVRAELKQPTFFNILGPLLSPAQADKQLIGTPKLEYARLIAEVAQRLGKERVIVAVGSDGLDEVTLTGPTSIIELKAGKINEYEINPHDFGLDPVGLDQLSSNDPAENIKIAKNILDNKGDQSKTQLVLINSAMALYLAGRSEDLKACYKLAEQSLTSKSARSVMENYRTPSVLARIAARDKSRNFSIDSDLPGGNLKYDGGLIAEIKKNSPSEGDINSKLNIVAQAKLYERAGASAISVLCEPEDFKGSFEDLKKIRQSVSLPLLCKDFFFRKEHIDKAKSCGADMILLIAACLDKNKLQELHDHAEKTGLQAIVEVHTEEDLQKALQINPKIVGVNCRNLHDFSIDMQTFEHLSSKIPEDILKIAESGITTYGDVPEDYDGILVGTVLMKHPFPNLKIKELLGKPILKLCGIRNEDDAKLCEELKVDLIGINFVPRSKRKVNIEKAQQIATWCKNTIVVGIFENQNAAEVNRTVVAAGLDAVQLSGGERNLDEYEYPIIKTIRPGQVKPEQAFLSIIDNDIAGSGHRIDLTKIKRFEPSLIAGGVDLEAAREILKLKSPLGIDTASGIEADGRVDPGKIKQFAELISTINY